jgi:hypothetical protein
MRQIILVTFILASLSGPAQKKAVSFQIKQIHPYCGGARPSPEMEAAAQLAQPYANQKLFIVSDKGYKDSVITDTEGYLKTNLKAGTYKIYEAWKFYKKTPNGEALTDFDKECLKKEWKKEDLKITFVNGKAQIKNNIERAKCPWQQNCLMKKNMPE